MITFEDLKQKWTLEITKRAIELADGYKYYEREMTVGNRSVLIKGISCGINSLETTEDFAKAICESSLFPLLLHRAVEGWNNKNVCKPIQILCNCVSYITDEDDPAVVNYGYDNEQYLPCHLTACEMTIMDCLAEVLK